MDEERRIIVERKEPVQYARFGTCCYCGSKIAVIGTRSKIEHYDRIRCKSCDASSSVLLGFLHKANGCYARRKLKKVEKDNANKGNQE